MTEKDRSPVIEEDLSPMPDENLVPEDEDLPTATSEDPSRARGRPFEKGKSGNPAGRPKGSRNRTTLAAEALLDGQAEPIMQKLVDVALSGDLTALRMCIDRILPVRRERRISFDLPRIDSEDDVVQAMEGIADAVASGELSFGEAGQAASFVRRHADAVKTAKREKDPARGVRVISFDENGNFIPAGMDPDDDEDC